MKEARLSGVIAAGPDLSLGCWITAALYGWNHLPTLRGRRKEVHV